MRKRKDAMATGASSGGTTLISSETTVKGDITFTGQLDVEGAIEGSIQAGSGDAVLRVVSGGRVSGEIKVPHATVNGKIEGDIHSSERLVLAEQAAIDGDVYYNLIEMSMGSKIDGNLKHSTASAKVEPISSASPVVSSDKS